MRRNIVKMTLLVTLVPLSTVCGQILDCTGKLEVHVPKCVADYDGCLLPLDAQNKVTSPCVGTERIVGQPVKKCKPANPPNPAHNCIVTAVTEVCAAKWTCIIQEDPEGGLYCFSWLQLPPALQYKVTTPNVQCIVTDPDE